MTNIKKAFSLVELSIVIIILGLLVASVTVGRDLINAAQIRGVITQLNTFDTAINTFEMKYSDLPGDIANANRRGLGSNNGDGDGIYEDSDYDSDSLPNLADNEIVYFWEHLTLAGFTNGEYDGDSSNGVIGETFPKAKTGGGITIYGVSGVNYYHVGIDDSSSGELVFDEYFVPEDAFAVDNKIDDGYPLKGSVIARSSSCSSDPNAFSCANTAITTSDGASTTSGTTCVYQIGSSQDVSQDEYDFDTTSPTCNLRIEMQ